MKYFKYSFLIFLISVQIFNAQNINPNLNPEEIISGILITYDIEDEERIHDNLVYLLDNPIKINYCTREELTQLPFLENDEIDLLIDKRKTTLFNSTKDLEEILHNQNSIKFLKYFVDFENTNFINLNDLIINPNAELRNRIKINSNTGSSSSYNRLNIKTNNVRFLSIIDKDYGELSLYDYSTLSISIKDVSFIKQLIVGDYYVKHGFGLASFTPYKLRFNNSTFSEFNFTQNRILPNSFGNENKFLRGVAIDLKLGALGLLLFVNHNKISATLNNDGSIKSIYNTGYYTSENEKSKKRNTDFNSFGASASFKYKSLFSASILFSSNKLNRPFNSSGNPNSYSYNYLSFSAKTKYKSLIISTEAASDFNKAKTISNLLFAFSKSLKLLTSFRYYPEEYIDIWGSSFGKNYYGKNEYGFLTAILIKNKFGNLFSYIDSYNFNIGQSNGFKKYGNDFHFAFNSIISRRVTIFLKFTNKINESTDAGNLTNIFLDSFTRKYRIGISYAEKLFRLRLRIEKTDYNSDENGILIFNDLRMNLMENIAAYFRFIYFDTESFNSRVYEFENDLYGQFSNIALFGNGFRWYVYFKLRFLNIFTAELKYSQTYKNKLPDDLIFQDSNNQFLSIQLQTKL